MLRADVVREILARLARGEGIKRIARDLGVDRKTVKAWRARGGWRPRPPGSRRRRLDSSRPFIEARAPVVGLEWRGAAPRAAGPGVRVATCRCNAILQPLRAARQWAAVATMRFETAPGEQAQVDFGQLRLSVADVETIVQLFVFTLGYSRRLWTRAYPRASGRRPGWARARLPPLRGGVPLTCLYDNPRTQVLGRRERQVLWHPVSEDFARYYGFTPRACQPYRAQTKGKVESGVKYCRRGGTGEHEAPLRWRTGSRRVPEARRSEPDQVRVDEGGLIVFRPAPLAPDLSIFGVAFAVLASAIASVRLQAAEYRLIASGACPSYGAPEPSVRLEKTPEGD